MTDKKEMHDKPLDKMTVTELREVAKEIPDLTGVHGMKKAELLAAVQEAKGVEAEAPEEPKAESVEAEAPKEPKAESVEAEAPKKTKAKGKAKSKTALTVPEMKALIKGLRSQRVQALADKDKKKAKIFRRRISRLKKKTRQAA